MLYGLPLETNYLIWSHLPFKDLVVLGLINRDCYLHILDKIESANLFYKNLSRCSLSKIKLSIKLDQIFCQSDNYNKSKISIESKSDCDLYVYEFKHVDKYNLDKIREQIKANRNNMIIPRDFGRECCLMSPNIFGQLECDMGYFSYKIFLRGLFFPLKYFACSRGLMQNLKDRFYIYHSDEMSNGNMVFMTAYYKYESFDYELKCVNYTLRNGDKMVTLSNVPPNIFWYIADIDIYHIVGISTIINHQGWLDIYLIKRELLDNSHSEINLNHGTCYNIRLPIDVQPRNVTSTPNGTGSMLYIFVLCKACFLIYIFDMSTKMFLPFSLNIQVSPNSAYAKYMLTIINDEYLVIVSYNFTTRVVVHWIDIRKGRLKLDQIVNYDSPEIRGINVFSDGILVKENLAQTLNCYNYNFY